MYETFEIVRQQAARLGKTCFQCGAQQPRKAGWIVLAWTAWEVGQEG